MSLPRPGEVSSEVTLPTAVSDSADLTPNMAIDASLSRSPEPPPALVGAGETVAGQKRTPITRINTACQACRSRKYRCNGQTPCDKCERSKIACIYTPNKRTRRTKPEDNIFPFASAGGDDGHRSAIPIESNLANYVLSNGSEAAPSGHGSNLYANGMNGADASEGVRSTIRSDTGTMAYETPLASTEVFALPGREHADLLLATYLELGLDLLPVLHTETLQSLYASLWTPQAQPDPVVHALVNICFAVASRLRQGLEVGTLTDAAAQALAEAHYARARQLIAYDAIEGCTLLTVQVLLLMTLYSQSISSTTRAWNTLGAAIRMATALGLNLDRKPQSEDDLVVLELRRRAWWACVFLDTELTMTTGRESLIRIIRCTTRRPTQTDDSYIHAGGIHAQPADDLPRIALFNVTLELYDILARILAEAHVVAPPTSAAHLARLQTMLALDGELESWQGRLPDLLQFDPTGFDVPPPWLDRHRHILRSRLYLVRTLLFRPSIMRTVSPSTQDSFGEGVTRLASTACLDAAYRLLMFCTNHQDQVQGGPWWFRIFYIYTTSSVLLAARWTHLTHADFDTAWTRGMTLLERSGRSTAAQILNAILQRLSDGTGLGTDIVLRLHDSLGVEGPAFDNTLFAASRQF